MKKLALPLIVYVAALGAYALLAASFTKEALPLSLARAQSYVFPVFLASLVLFRLGKANLSLRSAIILCLLGYGAIAYAYTYRARTEPAVVITPLQGDQFATKAKIFQDEVIHAAQLFGGVEPSIEYDKIGSHADALALLEKNRNILAVVWGTPHWITLSMRTHVGVESVQSMHSSWYSHALPLELITAVPSLGISYSPVQDTSFFIAALFSNDEVLLRAASELQARWSSYAHRAYSGMLLGNLLFRKAMLSETYQISMFDCAIEAYSDALRHVNGESDIPLRKAILNNLAIISYIQGDVEKNKELGYQAQEWLRVASKAPDSLQKNDGVYYAAPVALRNYSVIRADLLSKRRDVKHGR